MYGPLIVLIAAVPVLLLAIALLVIPYLLYNYHYEKSVYVAPGPYGGFKAHFYNNSDEIQQLKRYNQTEEVQRLQKNWKKQHFWKRLYDIKIVFITIVAITLLVMFIFGLITLLKFISIPMELTRWEEFVIVAEETLQSSNELQSTAVVSQVLQYNEWIANARASQRIYGNWSLYYGVDLPEPLLLS